MSTCLVIIPTYNEAENVEAIIRAVFGLREGFEILIVDDNSKDGTAGIVKNLISQFPEMLYLESRMGKLGLGTAYIHGFKWALKRNYDLIFEMDADFSHNPKDLVALKDACEKEGFDLAIGSRYIKGVNVVNWPLNRVLISYFASIYVRIITSMPVKDSTAGFICYKRKVLETIDLDKIQFVGYAFQIEMKFNTWKHGFKIKEVPIVFTDRTLGESKMSKGILMEAFVGVIQMKWRSLFGEKY